MRETALCLSYYTCSFCSNLCSSLSQTHILEQLHALSAASGKVTADGTLLSANLARSRCTTPHWGFDSWMALNPWSCCFTGGRAVSTPDFPEPLRSSMTDADGQPLRRDMWPRRNVPNPTAVPHVTSALPEPLQNSFADAEYVNVRARH